MRKKTRSSTIHHGLVTVNMRVFNGGKVFWTDKPTGQDVLFVNEINREFGGALIALHPYCQIVGEEHIRRYGDSIYKKKTLKKVGYKLAGNDKVGKLQAHGGFNFDYTPFLKKKIISSKRKEARI